MPSVLQKRIRVFPGEGDLAELCVLVFRLPRLSSMVIERLLQLRNEHLDGGAVSFAQVLRVSGALTFSIEDASSWLVMVWLGAMNRQRFCSVWEGSK